MSELEPEELDFGYAKGFLREALKDANKYDSATLLESLEVLVSGIDFYRKKYTTVQEDLAVLNERYNGLMSTSAGYLQLISQQREQIDQMLIEGQREFHREPNFQADGPT